MNDVDREIDLKPYLAAMTATDPRKRAAAVAFAKVELPTAALAALAGQLAEGYQRVSSPAVRDATGASLSELGEPAVRPVLRAIHRSRRDAVRLRLVLLLCELKTAIPIFERLGVADSLAAVEDQTACDRLKAACGLARTILIEDELT